MLKNEQGIFVDNEEQVKKITYFLNLLFRKEKFRNGQLPILTRAMSNCTSGKDEVKRVSSAYRNHSIDARGWADPCVTEDEIKEKVLFRYFPHMGRIR